MLIRLLDVVFAFFGLLFTFPILITVIIIGYFDTGSPVFIQKRMGKNKRPFKLIKFRTMSVDTKSVASHLASATSITKLGSFLRKTKIDELPQLINVLKGEMSFVGPRPNLFNQEELITERDNRGVYMVLPGITGLAQVKGYRGATDTLEKMEGRIKYDLEYIRSWSLWLDIKLIVMTVFVGFTNKNAY